MSEIVPSIFTAATIDELLLEALVDLKAARGTDDEAAARSRAHEAAQLWNAAQAKLPAWMRKIADIGQRPAG